MTGNWNKTVSPFDHGATVVMYGVAPGPESPRIPWEPAPYPPVFPVPPSVTFQPAVMMIDAAQFGELMDELRTLRHAVDRLHKEVEAMKPRRRKTKTGGRR